MSRKMPFLPLSVDAYQHDTAHLSLEEHGAYLILLMEAWKRPTASLPDDDEILARLLRITPAKWRKLKPAIMSFWAYDGRSRTWVQKRLKKEKDYVEKTRRKKRDAAASRWEKEKTEDASAHAHAMQPPPPPPHISYPSQEETTYEVGDTRETPFDGPTFRVMPGGLD